MSYSLSYPLRGAFFIDFLHFSTDSDSGRPLNTDNDPWRVGHRFQDASDKLLEVVTYAARRFRFPLYTENPRFCCSDLSIQLLKPHVSQTWVIKPLQAVVFAA